MSTPATHVEDQLLDFAYGELTERDAQAVQAHLSACAQCQASLDDIQGVRKVMAKLPPSDAPNDGLDSLIAYAEQAARRVQAGPAPKKTWWRALILPLGGVAAAAIFFIVGQEVSKDTSLEEAAHQAAVAKVSGESRSEAAAAAPAQPAPAPEVAIASPPPAEKELKLREAPAAVDDLFAAARGAARADEDEDAKRELRNRSQEQRVAAQAPAAATGAIADAKDLERQTRAKADVARDEAPSPAKKKAATLPSIGDGRGAFGEGQAAGSGLNTGDSLGRLAGGGGMGTRDTAPSGPVAKNAPAPERTFAKPTADAPKPAAPKAADKDAFSDVRKAESAPPPPVTPSATAGKGGETDRARAPARRTAVMQGLSVDSDDRAAEAEAQTEMVAAAEEAKPAARDAEAKALLDQALAANRAGRYDEAIRSCRQALALTVDDVRIRQGALNALCEAESELRGDLSACEALVRDYPSSGAAKMAKRRIATVQNRGGAAATGAPAPRPPYATEKRAAPLDATEPPPADAVPQQSDTSN